MDNKVYAPNPNWFSQLPMKFRDMIIQAEGDHADEIQATMANYLLDKSDVDQNVVRKYQPIHLFPIPVENVSIQSKVF